MYITEDYTTGNNKQLVRFNDLIEALNHLLQWPNQCKLFFKSSSDKPATLLAYKEM